MRHRHRAILSAPCLVLSSLLFCANAHGSALGDNPTRFDLPAESLDKALRDLAIQGKINISYVPSLVVGLSAPAIKGDFTLSDALSLLLKGTRLRAVPINENTIQILSQESTLSNDSSAADDRAAISRAGTPDFSTPSFDDSDKTLTEIVVTGTNITGIENKTVPLLTFDRDAIDRSGYATTADFIDSLPQNVKSGANSADGVLTGLGLGNLENSTAANLRGLGTSSTLTLINGHRMAPSSYGTGVDLSMIPLSAVERIEVLTDGSSAVYGSDAVGGVINIILRQDFNGQESSARLDTLSRGGGELKQVGQSVGRTWSTGGALAVFQFEDANAIHADQRSFTENLPQPTDVYPATKRYSGVFSGHQALVGSLDLFADALVEHHDGYRAYTTGGAFSQVELITTKTNAVSANAGLRWQPFGDWHLEASTLFSQVYTPATEVFTPPQFGYLNGTPYLRNLATLKEGDLKLDGTLFAVGSTHIKAAIGGSYRSEDFSSLVPDGDIDRAADRHVHAAFAEIYAPLIGNANAIPAVKKLEFSAAVRNDSYSDFGSKTNPRFGVFWSPVDPLEFRAAYSTSFRAPDPNELVTDLTVNNVFIQSGSPLPGGSTGNVIYFGNQTLGPETSRNLTAGLDFKPAALPDTRFSLNYYRIIYSNRIINAPGDANVFINPQIYGPLIKHFSSDAAVAAFVAGLEPPQTLFDFTNGGTGLAGVRYGFPYGYINATKEHTEGLDLGAHSLLSLTADKLIFDLNATYIREIETTFCDGCTAADLVNTYGQPLKFRARAAAGWSHGGLSANAAVNYANAYIDTNVVPSGRISSFTTADVNLKWHIAPTGTTLSVIVTNLFNTNPPRTAPAINAVTYDPSNADPRGRILSLQVRQAW
jgi:iron complex outermembrane receptor protein